MMKKTSEMENDKLIVTGLFKNREDAECAYGVLAQHGYDEDQTDVMMSNETRDRYYSGSSDDETELGTKALEGTGVGAAVGGTVGATVAALAAIGTSIALPGLGLVIAGPLAAALVGAGAGGLTGGLIGALIGSGIPEDHAAAYESGIQSGGIVLRTHPRTAEEASIIESNWRECGGEKVYSNLAGKNATAASSSRGNEARRRDTNQDEVTIPVIEEELQVGKRTVQTSGVRVTTNASEHPVEKTVTLRDEEINVERRPVDRAADESDISAMREGEFVVTETDEKVVSAKRPRVVEEVVIGKDVTAREETVSDTVRRTEVEVEELSGEQRERAKRAAK